MGLAARRPFVLAALGGAGLALVLVVARRFESGRPRALAPTSTSPASVEAVRLDAAPASRRGELEGEPTERVALEEASSTAEGPLELAGTLVAVDGAGHEHAEEDGAFAMSVWRGRGGGLGQRIEVHAGGPTRVHG